MKENSWREVGILGQGHVLLKLARDGKTYEHVEIKSINIVKSDVKEVYGVHLREGLRSYHANGYLVAINYPEVSFLCIWGSNQSSHLLGDGQISCKSARQSPSS